jgi:hypothetical protein
MEGPIPPAIARAISQYEAVAETARKRETERGLRMNEAHNSIKAERERADLIALDQIKYGPKSAMEEMSMAAHAARLAELRREAGEHV